MVIIGKKEDKCLKNRTLKQYLKLLYNHKNRIFA